MNNELQKIIVVDDNPENLNALRNTLKDIYEVYPSPSAAKMFDLLKHINPELILLDVGMPGMDGYEALQKLKSDAQYREIPVIFLTSMNDAQDEMKGLRLGAVDYIRKPFVAPLLLQRIKTHLAVMEQQAEIKRLLDLKTEEVKLREKAELDAENASRAKSDFLSHMSHEIRSPLNAVIGMINIANEENEIDAIKLYLNKAHNAAKHVLGVINDILDMSKIEANKFELSDNEFDFGKMMTNIIDVTSIRALEKHQQIAVTLDKDIPSFIICDELRLAQVITNLMTNAIKFTPENGKVELNAQMLESPSENGAPSSDSAPCEHGEITLKIEVRDSGIGISHKQQQKLFSAYNQADRTIAKQFGGTGLGLVITRQIIELMQGKIWIESELGKGAKFIFTIKVKKGTQSADKTSTAGEPAASSAGRIKASDLHLQGYTILAAEDMDFNREVLAKYLEKTGVSIDFAEDGKQAVAMFKENYDKYCLIFMDINMPEMDGDEATRIIRALDLKKAKEIPIIAMTADVFKEDIEKCLSVGMNDHISKPIVPKIIYEKLKQYLEAGV
ncbi:MAG: response regulator [Treponema sp.]|jgi:signal transduction histidine kinase|nr:response regulator [Treponema sp.]